MKSKSGRHNNYDLWVINYQLYAIKLNSTENVKIIFITVILQNSTLCVELGLTRRIRNGVQVEIHFIAELLL